MSGIYTGDFAGQVRVNPALQRINDPLSTLTQVTTAGYLSNSPTVANNPPQPGDFVFVIFNGGQGIFSVSISNNVISLTAWAISTSSLAGQTVSVTTASATPGTIRSLRGLAKETASVMTSGNLVGLRGEVDYVGASGGFLYCVQGKLIPTGTVSGSSWNAGLFGQLDISAATVNAGQMAPIWADYGASSGTLTDVTGLRMFAGTNTTAATLNSMIYLYGKTSNLLELDANGSTYISTGGATASGTIKKIAILIEGVQYYLQAATVYS